MRLTVLHGPNMNLLGQREPERYGSATLAELNQQLTDLAEAMGVALRIEQHNYEGGLVEAVHRAAAGDGLLINPAAYTHTSVALRDALLGTGIPTVEVHMTEPKTREAFRQINMIEDIALARFAGAGVASYTEGLRKLVDLLRERAKNPHL